METKQKKNKTDKPNIKKKRNTTKKGKKFYEDSTESDHSSTYISDSEEGLLNLTMADLAETLSEDEDIDLIEMAAKDSKFKVGDWVLVSFSTKTSVTHYIAQVIDFSEDEPIV